MNKLTALVLFIATITPEAFAQAGRATDEARRPQVVTQSLSEMHANPTLDRR